MKMFLQCDVSNSVESNKDICHRSQKKERADMEKKEQGMEVGGCGLNGAMKSSTRTQSIEH